MAQYPSPYAQNNPYQTIYRGFNPKATNRFQTDTVAPAAKTNRFQTDTVAGAKPGQPPGTIPGGPTPPVAPPPDPYNVNGDPALQMVLGQNQNMLNQAGQQRTEDQRKLLLGYGSQSLAKQIFGGDPSFQQAVGNNPFSTLGNIAHQFEGQSGLVNQTNEQQNAHNLFFSSNRTNVALPEVYRQRQQQEYDANIAAQEGLSSITRSYLDTQNQAVNAEVAARQDAASRAIQAALASGYGPGASNTTTTAPFTQVGGAGGETTPWAGRASY